MNKSKWSSYDQEIEKTVRTYPEMGYSDLAKKVLGHGAEYADVDVFRTYIRRNFGDLKDSITGDGKEPRLLIYDIETSQVVAKMWWSGTQFVSGKRMIKESKIISISWKWLGEDQIHDVWWDENHCDKKLLQEFLKEYNAADMVIGVNNDRFDNRFVNARAAKHGLDINTFIRSFDIQKESKRLFRLPSYSMDYMCKYLEITHKQQHEGIKMWDMVEDGTPEQQKEYLEKMIDYNRGDIVSTEEWYLRIRKYMGHKTHLGCLQGKEKWTCPDTGSENVKLYRNDYTAAGTLKRIMVNIDTDFKYKISNRAYMQFIESKQSQDEE